MKKTILTKYGKEVIAKEMIRLRNEGKTYQEIANLFGQTRQAIFQCLKRYDKNRKSE